MTALTAMQTNWIKNTEDGLITCILIWDLSAAFDTVVGDADPCHPKKNRSLLSNSAAALSEDAN